jgi:2C-methyl-D-erythritol 2,4-cyclodiphosphate synthase
MPLIKLEYDDSKVGEEDAAVLASAIQKIVSTATGIEDVFVYANTAKIKVKIAPIEIFIEMSAHKIDDADKLIGEVKAQLSSWKVENNFPHPINLTLIPMNWKIELGI